MLKDGKETFDFDYNLTSIQAFNIQNQINKAEDIAQEDKSDAVVSNGQVESSTSNNDYNTMSLGMFETFGGSGANARARNIRSREQLYDTYSRMSKMGFVQRAIEVVSDEATQKNEFDEVLKIDSQNEKIYNCLHDLFYNKLSINTELWSMFYETIKNGDNFYEVTLDVKDHTAYGIKRLKYLDPAKIEAHEKDGRIDYYVYKSAVKNNNERLQIEQRLFPWQIIHFRIENKESKPYGRSLLYSGIRSFERLVATEDIFLTYIISRTPSRRVFKIDVGGLPQLEAQRAIREIRDSYRSKQVIDSEGNLNQISSLLSITSDIFIPVREGQNGTTIETLQGDAMNMNQNMNFIENFKRDLISSLIVPYEYLGVDTNQNVGQTTTLSQKDIKFARFIERLQQQCIKPLYKIATLELFFNGFTGEDLRNFTLALTNPSTIKETAETAFLGEKVSLAGNIKNLDMFPTTWILKRIIGLSDKEISEIQFLNSVEKQQNQQNNPEMGGGAMGGMSMPMGNEMPMGGELPPEGEMPPEGEIPPEGEMPPEGEAPQEPVQEPGLETQGVSYLNVDGQKFLIEDEQRFLTLMKYINEQKKYQGQNESEFVSKAKEVGKLKSKALPSTNLFGFLKEQNEFGGLKFRDSSINIQEGLSNRVHTLHVNSLLMD